ncbi:calumenin [Cinnamomum micranthum f. kanehirae]|uniref:Calumenin n=1 Tax=Cinnamomum micranthum f. kanehirae TaxID=337451 RepID=A0A3S3ME11_9MAGN|nr:calumenin [Cinnamomum micranthum f. kanehirae]
MAKTGTVLVYITLTVVILVFISLYPTKTPYNHHHRRLKLRSSFDPRQHSPIPFDPIVADIERIREDRIWERETHQSLSAPGHESQPEWEDFMDAEDFLNDEERFNVTTRIISLFPKIDLGPVDGFVSLEEMTEWNVRSAMREVMHRTARDMELHDKNRDGFVSFQEYEPPSWATKLHSDNNSHVNDIGWWKEDHFYSADEDGDGRLNQTEFNNFLHPVDSKNPKLLRWLSREEIRERDTDRDGKLGFKEFFHGLFDLLRDYEEVGHNTSHESDDMMEAPAKKLFAELDKDNDGYLSEGELLLVIDKIHPSERYYAKQQADYVISQADTNKDGRLSLEEMIENPYVFYTAIFTDEDDYQYHDEFR